MRTSGLGPGAISGTELQALSDDQLKQQLPNLHVFGRVTPQDKLRLARAMQEQGMIVAMTGDAVNDAAALKQADIGVAMGSGSEVTKQAARMVLTDDNFGTLVHAVGIGRRVYAKVVSYVRYQMTQLLALVFLFLAATVFNVNQGVAMTPPMVLYLLFFATAVGVVIIAVDPGDPDVMHRPPRDPSVTITNRGAVVMWVIYALVLFVAAFVPLVAGPDEPSPIHASVSMTMTFTVMGLGTAFNAIVNRRDPTSGLTPPLLKAAAIALIPVAMVFLATQLPTVQGALLTVPLTRSPVARLRRPRRPAPDRRRGGQGGQEAPSPDAGVASAGGCGRAGTRRDPTHVIECVHVDKHRTPLRTQPLGVLLTARDPVVRRPTRWPASRCSRRLLLVWRDQTRVSGSPNVATGLRHSRRYLCRGFRQRDRAVLRPHDPVRVWCGPQHAGDMVFTDGSRSGFLSNIKVTKVNAVEFFVVNGVQQLMSPFDRGRPGERPERCGRR